MVCVHSLLYLQLGYEGELCQGQEYGGQTGITREGLSQLPPLGFSQDHRDDVVEQLLTLKDGLVNPDTTILFHTCHSIAQVLTGFHNKEESGAKGCPRKYSFPLVQQALRGSCKQVSSNNWCLQPHLVSSDMWLIPACFGTPQSGQDQDVLCGKVLVEGLRRI